MRCKESTFYHEGNQIWELGPREIVRSTSLEVFKTESRPRAIVSN